MAIALVTGTSTGIGLATAVSLARGGHTVIATMRNLESAGDLQTAVEKLPVTLAALNVDDDSSVENALGKVLAEHTQEAISPYGMVRLHLGHGGMSLRFRFPRNPDTVYRWERVVRHTTFALFLLSSLSKIAHSPMLDRRTRSRGSD